jgi:glycosyltransferase involved in cell wall biosynthesis
LYEQAQLVLCPSRFEAAPLVPREAIRAGVPVLLSDIAPHRELLPESTTQLLPVRVEEWAGPVSSLLTSAAARERLKQLQEPAARDQSEALWRTCCEVYQQLLL